MADFVLDPAQQRAQGALRQVHEALLAQPPRRRFGAPRWPRVPGLYLWGSVGRGKTWLVDAFHEALAPTVPLSRHIFRAPTRFYKTGVVFMAYLNGHQGHFTMVGGQESARSILHLAELFRLADKAGLLRDPDLAVERMRFVLATHGVEA